jgi:hypothetical protein
MVGDIIEFQNLHNYPIEELIRISDIRDRLLRELTGVDEGIAFIIKPILSNRIKENRPPLREKINDFGGWFIYE